MTFITATKKGFSATELQRQLGMKRYEPVFRMYHKLRVVMGKRDDRYRLEDMVEYDEAFVGKATKPKVKNPPEKRARKPKAIKSCGNGRADNHRCLLKFSLILYFCISIMPILKLN